MAQDDIYAENAPQSESEGTLREFFQSRRNQLIVGGGALGAALAITIGVMALNSNSEAQQAQKEAAATAQVNADESILDDSDYEGEYNPTETAAPTENVYAIRDSGGGGLESTGLDADAYANTQGDLDDDNNADSTDTDSTNTKSTTTSTADSESDEDPFAVETGDTHDEPNTASSSQTRPADGAGEGVGYMDATPASELRAIELNQGQNYVTSNNLAVNISQIRSKENSDGSTGTCGVLSITNRGQVPYTLDENTDIDFFTVDVNYNETPVKGSIYATTIGAGETATFTPCVSATEVDAFGWRPPTAPDRVAFWNS